MQTEIIIERDSIIDDKHLVYLDILSENKKVPMHNAVPFLMLVFPDLSAGQAMIVLKYWISLQPVISVE